MSSRFSLLQKQMAMVLGRHQIFLDFEVVSIFLLVFVKLQSFWMAFYSGTVHFVVFLLSPTVRFAGHREWREAGGAQLQLAPLRVLPLARKRVGHHGTEDTRGNLQEPPGTLQWVAWKFLVVF